MFTSKHSPLRVLGIGLSMHQAGSYGSIAKIVSSSNIPRSTCYYYKAQVSQLLTDTSWRCSPQRIEAAAPPALSRVEFILGCYLSGKCTIKSICEFLRVQKFKYGTGIVSDTLNNYGSCLPEIDVLPPEGGSVCLSIDEIFIGGRPCLMLVDNNTGYIFGILLRENRNKETWVACLSKLLGDGEFGSLLVSADFASAIGSALSDLGLLFQGDLFHYFRYICKALAQMWHTFERLFGQMEKAEKQYKNAQKKYNGLIIPTQKDADNLAKAQTAYEEAFQRADDSRKHYDNARYLLHHAMQQFHYFDDNGQWISHRTVQNELQTVCEYLSELPCDAMQKAAKFCHKHLSEVTQYIAKLEPHILEQQQSVLPNTPKNDPDNDLFVRQIVALIVKNLRLEQATNNTQQQQYHKKQAQILTTELEQYCGQKVAQGLIQQCQQTLQKYHRSSSMTENANSRIKPYCNMSRGQMTQEKLNLIRHYLNNSPFLRSRSKQRKNKTPHQLLHQLSDENTIHWWDSLEQLYQNKKNKIE